MGWRKWRTISLRSRFVFGFLRDLANSVIARRRMRSCVSSSLRSSGCLRFTKLKLGFLGRSMADSLGGFGLAARSDPSCLALCTHLRMNITVTLMAPTHNKRRHDDINRNMGAEHNVALQYATTASLKGRKIACSKLPRSGMPKHYVILELVSDL